MTTKSLKKSAIYYGWWLVLVTLILQGVGMGASLYLYSVVAAALEQTFPGGRALIMMGATALILFTALFSPKTGTLLDRYPVKWVLIAGALVMGAGFILVSFSNHIWQVILCYALFISVGLAVLSPLAASTLLSRWFVRHRGLAIGIAALGTQFGGLIYPPIIAHVIDLYDFRIAMAGLGVFVMVAIPALIWFTVVDFPHEKGLAPDGAIGARADSATVAQQESETISHVTMAQLFCQRNFLLLVVAISGATAVNTAVISNLSLFAIDLGESAGRGAYLISLLAVLGMISSPLTGRLCDIWDIRRVAVGMFVCSATASLVFLAANSYALLLCAVFLQGIVGGSVIPLWASLVGRIVDTRIYGKVMGATILVVYSVAASAPFLAGWWHDMTGSYRLLFLVMALVMFNSTVCAAFLRIPAAALGQGDMRRH